MRSDDQGALRDCRDDKAELLQRAPGSQAAGGGCGAGGGTGSCRASASARDRREEALPDAGVGAGRGGREGRTRPVFRDLERGEFAH